MSLKLLALIAGILGFVIPAIPSWVGQVRVEALGTKVRAAAMRGLEIVKRALPPAISALIVFAFVVVFGGGGGVGIASNSENHLDFLHSVERAFLDVLVISAILIALALALGVILGITCIAAPIVARIPTGPRTFVTAGVLLGVVSLVITYAIT